MAFAGQHVAEHGSGADDAGGSPSRRSFLRGAGAVGVTGAGVVAATPVAADEVEADHPFDVAKVVRVRRRRLDVKIRRTGATVRVTPEYFKRGWRFKRGDLVAVERWGSRRVAVPFVQTHTGSALRGSGDRVRIGGTAADVDTDVAARSVRRARRRLRRGADRVVGVFARNTRTGRLRCLGVRADG